MSPSQEGGQQISGQIFSVVETEKYARNNLKEWSLWIREPWDVPLEWLIADTEM